MKDNYAIKSKFRIFKILFYTVLSLGSLICGSFLLDISLRPDYPQIFGIIIGGMFAVAGALYLLSVLFLKRYEIYDKKLVVKNLFEVSVKEIYLDDIIFYSVSGDDGSEFLMLFMSDSNLNISSDYITNYSDIKSTLIRGKKKQTEEINSKLGRHATKGCAVIFIIVGGLFMFGLIKNYISKEIPLQSKELVTISGVIAKNPVIKRSSGRKRWRSKYMDIYIADYPKFNFDLSGYAFKASNTADIVKDVRIGDTVEIDILKSVYQQKILRTKAMNFWDKSVNYNSINIYGLRRGNREYLTLYNYNVANNRDEEAWVYLVFFIIVGFIFFTGFILLFGERLRLIKEKLKQLIFDRKL